MKKVLYYVLLAIILLAFTFVITFILPLFNSKPGGWLFYLLAGIAFSITAALSPYIKKWLGIVEEDDNDNKQ